MVIKHVQLTGSMAYVHYLCLERWLNYSSRETCELCSDRFNVVSQRRYSCLQSVRIWTRHPANRTFILCDLAIGLALTLLTLSLVVICLVGLNKFSQEENYDGNIWRQGIVDVVLLVLLAGYFATMYSMARDHIRPWYTWWTHCKKVKLVLDKSSTQVIRSTNNDNILCPTGNATCKIIIKANKAISAEILMTLKNRKEPNHCEKELEVAEVEAENFEEKKVRNKEEHEQVIFVHMPSTSHNATEPRIST